MFNAEYFLSYYYSCLIIRELLLFGVKLLIVWEEKKTFVMLVWGQANHKSIFLGKLKPYEAALLLSETCFLYLCGVQWKHKPTDIQ